MDRLLRAALGHIKRGNLQMTSARGSVLSFGDGTGPPIAARFTSAAAQCAALLDPELRLGEAYMDGTFVVEKGSIADFIDLVTREHVDAPPWTAWEELFVRGAYELLVRYKRPKPPDDLARLADVNLARYRDVVHEAHAAGARVLLVWHPTVDALSGATEPSRERFLALDDARLDLGPAYRAAGGRVYSDGMHLSVAGHRVAGEAIGDALRAIVP